MLLKNKLALFFMFTLQVIDSFCPLDIFWKIQSEYVKHDQFWWCSAGGLGGKNPKKSQVNCPAFIASVGKLAKNTANCAKQLLLTKHLVFLGERWTPQKLKNVLEWGSAVVLCTLLTRLFFFPFWKTDPDLNNAGLRSHRGRKLTALL